ncbi:tetraacyldisaccharide 4'-kinase [bacterium]|nr:tetraacyldisaccharide 4'-kinase [bacterium]
MKLFISKLHYTLKKDRNIAQNLVLACLLALSVFYRLVVWLRNRLYDFKILRSYKSEALVVSVGNLTTGGVGKTPVVSEIANYYSRKGKKTAILSRGYGGSLDNKLVNLISDGSGPLVSAQESGDEPFWLAENSLSSFVLTSRNRILAAKDAKNLYGAEVLVLDDGFQYRKLSRNLNCILVDAKNKFGNEHLLPAGPLREGFNEVRRADRIIVVNKSSDDKEALKYCDELKTRFKKPVYLCKMMPEVVYNLTDKNILQKGSRIIAFSAIGQPKDFYSFLQKDYKLTAVVDFEDHHDYTLSDIERLVRIARKEKISNLVTTEKDAVKIASLVDFSSVPVSFYALKLRAVLDLEDILNG